MTKPEFIRLTKLNDEYPFFVNPVHIVGISRHGQRATRIHLPGDHPDDIALVRESCEEVMQQIGDLYEVTVVVP